MRARRWLVTAPLVLLLACGPSVFTTPFTTLKPPPRTPAPRSPDSVEVFTTPRIEHPYVEVGLVTAYGGGEDAAFLHELRAEAATHGCDALYVQTPADSRFVGTCLMYTDAPTPKR